MENLNSLLIVSILLGVVLNIHSQNYYGGLVGGFNYADMEFVAMRIDQKVETRREFGIGAIFGRHLNDNISFQAEPMYLHKGGSLKYIEDERISINMKFTSLEIPLYMKVGFGNKIRSYVLAGPTLGFVLSSKSEVELGIFQFDIDIKDIIKDLEFGLTWGGGFSIPLGDSSFFIQGTYTVGLTNLNKGGFISYAMEEENIPEIEVNKEDKIKNKGLKIMAGFTFPLGN